MDNVCAGVGIEPPIQQLHGQQSTHAEDGQQGGWCQIGHLEF